MTKEFSDWTSYDEWLVSFTREKQEGEKKDPPRQFDIWRIQKIQEKDGKIVVDMEEKK